MKRLIPDWSYQTVFRPCLFRLPPRLGQRIALASMGTLARLPLGCRVIQLMGHMQPDPRLRWEAGDTEFSSRVGLGGYIDPQMTATAALAEFGFGFCEIGPVAIQSNTNAGEITRDARSETLRYASPYESVSCQFAIDRLQRSGPFAIPILARVGTRDIQEAREVVLRLAPHVDGFIVPLELANDSEADLLSDGMLLEKTHLLWVCVAVEDWQNQSQQEVCKRSIDRGSVNGIVVTYAREDVGEFQIGRNGLSQAVETVRAVRQSIGPQTIVVGSAGVHAPADALDYLEAGADCVQVDSGLVFAGPGLPKRINEALLYREQERNPQPVRQKERAGQQAWFWALLMGLSMFLGGWLALGIATTRVVMPYDEAMSGLTREQLLQINDRLLAFMTHDRVTLSGTMLAVGIMYLALSWFGVRRGVHWAYVSVIVSAMAGFLSFFSFLGFGYFDPLHAFVTAILFQFLLLTIHSDLPERRLMRPPGLWNDGRWRALQWGQLMFVVHGAVLITAGLVISKIGMTSVFVPEDLEFMQSTAESLCGAHPQLVPLVAHDRASFGGMLISCGFATLLPALWGFGRGQAWLWWALMLAGNFAYGATILVHWTVGYCNLKHLLPAYGGLAWLWIGGLASYRFMVARDQSLEDEWRRRLSES